MKKIIICSLLFTAGLEAQPAPLEIAPPTSEKIQVNPVKSQVRISRIVVFSENGAAGVIILRERQQVDAGGTVVGVERLPMIRRELALAPGEVVTGPDGKIVTLKQVVGLLAQFADKWAVEDAPKK